MDFLRFHLISKETYFIRIFFGTQWEQKKIIMLLFLQLTAKSFQTFPEFPPNGPQKSAMKIFEILSFSFLTSDRRVKRGGIWDSGVVVQHIWGTFGPRALAL